jgi:diaminohydroxyphosphoribosylaminopyrimidine deaminase/5-amino-6-(5-phosphoribosylamino)uracil reductase
VLNATEGPTKNHLSDETWMERALDLARRSVGLASPNPAVGCVLVRDGVLVGEGIHEYDKRDHAEIAALKQAGDAARGANAYVTLEPCCHTGRTGPCSRALIEAGIARVVVATGDPNPAVNGQGMEQLRQAGIAVTAGILQKQAQRLNDGFARHIRTGLPFVTLKAGVSLDGRIAPYPGRTSRGAPVFLTGEQARADVQQIRHSVDALVTGINTVLQDDPQLTDRSGLPRRRALLRVVLDSALRIPLDSQLLRSAQDDLLVFCTIAPTDRQHILESLGVRVERIAPAISADAQTGGSAGRSADRSHAMGVSLPAVFSRLGEMGILSAMLEAGAQLNSSALSGGHVDKLILYYAPLFLGSDAVPLLQEPLAAPLPTGQPEITPVGRDVRLEAWLRDPWADPPGATGAGPDEAAR